MPGSNYKVDAEKRPNLAAGISTEPLSMCVWFDVVLMQHNSSSIGESIPLLGDCFLQAVQFSEII